MEKKVKSESKKYEEEGCLWKFKKAIENKWGDMKFDIVVGNPPYGKKKQGTYDIHFKIMNTILPMCKDKLSFIMPGKPLYSKVSDNWYNMFKNAVCVDIKPQSKSIFKGTEMEQTAIYYCDRNEIPENYCKKLDVEDNFINSLNETEKKFVKYFDTGKTALKYIDCMIMNNDKIDYTINNFLKNMNNMYYLNICYAYGANNYTWITKDFIDLGVLSKEDEYNYVDKNNGTKVIMGFNDKNFGINLINMLNSNLMKFALWLVKKDQVITKECYKYFPDLDYSTIETDEDLLIALGCTDPEEQKEILDYVNNFDFTQKRNDRFLKGEESEDEKV